MNGGIIMGHQASFIKFRNKKTLVEQLRKYEAQPQDKRSEYVEIVAVCRVKKALWPFAKGEFVPVVAGERGIIYNIPELKEELGITKFQQVIAVDCAEYYFMQVDQGIDIFEEYFEELPREVWTELLFGEVKS